MAEITQAISANQAYKQAEQMNATIRRSGDVMDMAKLMKTGTQHAADVSHSNFVQSLSAVGNDALNKIRKGEKAAILGAQGKASTVYIATAVQEMEITILEAKAMFEEFIRAYRNVISMQL